MYLRFDVENQVLKRIDDNKLADYSNEYLTCAFDFSKDWTSFCKFAIFKHENKNYRVAIVENECIVPGDVLQDDRFVITVYGVNDDIRITTNKVLIHLRDSGFTDEYDESSEFNPDMTETLMELVDTKVDKTVYNTTIETINENISELNENKVSVASFNDEIEDINNNLDNLDNVKVNVSSFNDEIETINNTISELDNDFKTHTHSKSDITDFAHTHVESDITDLKDYALSEDVPTRVSELDNDSGFVNDLSGYYNKEQVDDLINSVENKFILNGDKEIMQTGDILDFTVKIKEDGFVASNKDIFFYVKED